MARTITLRLSDAAYETVKHYAEADQQSMSSWIEGLLNVEDMRGAVWLTTDGCRPTQTPLRSLKPGLIAISTNWRDVE